MDRAVTISPSIYVYDDSHTMGCMTDYREWLATVALVVPKATDGADKQQRLVSKGVSGIRIHGRLFNDIACDEPVTDSSPTGGCKGSSVELTRRDVKWMVFAIRYSASGEARTVGPPASLNRLF